MLVTKPADLTLALQKATEVFIAIIVFPTDTNIIDIQQLLLHVWMKTKYDGLTLTHNLFGVILPTERYKNIHSNRAYLILPIIALYEDKIDKDATRTEVHWAKGKHKAKWDDLALYETANTSCKNFIMEVLQGSRGPRHVLYKHHIPQTPQPSHRVMFRTTHLRCGGYSQSDKTLFSNARWLPQCKLSTWKGGWRRRQIRRRRRRRRGRRGQRAPEWGKLRRILLFQVELYTRGTKRKPLMSRLIQQRHHYLTC